MSTKLFIFFFLCVLFWKIGECWRWGFLNHHFDHASRNVAYTTRKFHSKFHSNVTTATPTTSRIDHYTWPSTHPAHCFTTSYSTHSHRQCSERFRITCCAFDANGLHHTQPHAHTSSSTKWTCRGTQTQYAHTSRWLSVSAKSSTDTEYSYVISTAVSTTTTTSAYTLTSKAAATESSLSSPIENTRKSYQSNNGGECNRQ